MENIKLFDRNILTFIYFQSPYLVSLVFFSLGVFSMWICPKPLRHIILKHGQHNTDVGFYSSYNWTLVNLFIMPFALFILFSLYVNIPQAIHDLVTAGVLLPIHGLNDLEATFNYEIKKYDGLLIPLIFFVALFINFYDFFSYYFERDKDKQNTKEKDWTVAFQAWNGHAISKRKNLLFNFFMYSQQWLIIFIALVFVYKAFIIVMLLYRISVDQFSNIRFDVNYFDAYHQFGFWGLNPIYVYLLLMVVLFLAYLTIIRFIHDSRKVEWKFLPKYISYAILLIVFLTAFSVINVADKNLKSGRNKKIAELLQIKEKYSHDLGSGTISGLEFLELNEKTKAVDEKIKTALAQKVLPADLKIYYLILAIYVIQLRLILFPPKSWMDGLKAVFKHDV